MAPKETSLSTLTTSPETPITTLIFDVDDTLYDVGTGFTAHRNGYGAQSFMVNKLGFPTMEAAKELRDEYFAIYHSTAKALTIAEQEGRFPPLASGQEHQTRRFDAKDLAEWWATNLDYSMLGGPHSQLIEDLSSCPLQMVAFSNGPRKYVKRVLMQLGLWELFGEDRLFAVDDVLPYCKPEADAFQVVFDSVGFVAEECVMIEDSMKNIRCSKKLGMKTVLVTGLGRKREGRRSQQSASDGSSQAAADAAEATKPGDAPVEDDPAVDVSIETIDELRSVLPGLWQTPPTFRSMHKN